MSEVERDTTPWSTYLFVIGAGVFGLFSMLHINRFGVGGAFQSEIHLLAAITFFLIGITCLVYPDVNELSWRTRAWSYAMFLCAFAQGAVLTFCVDAPFEELERVEFIFVIATGVVSALAFSCALWIHLRWKPN